MLGTDPGDLGDVVWPGRFQEIDRFIVDGAHNPPAAEALVAALGNEKVDVIAGFCGDKDAEEVMRILSPRIRRVVAVATNNPRSLFLAGEALVLLGAYPWDGDVRFDASELLHAD